MTDSLDLDALEARILGSKRKGRWISRLWRNADTIEMSLTVEDANIYEALCNAAPALIAAARERGRLAAELQKAHGDMDATMKGWDSLCEHSDKTEDELSASRTEITRLREALKAAEPLIACEVRAREALERRLDAFAKGLSGIIDHADQGRAVLAKVRAALKEYPAEWPTSEPPPVASP